MLRPSLLTICSLLLLQLNLALADPPSYKKPPGDSFTLERLLAKQVGGSYYYEMNVVNNKNDARALCSATFSDQQTGQQDLRCGGGVRVEIIQSTSRNPVDGFTVLVNWE